MESPTIVTNNKENLRVCYFAILVFGLGVGLSLFAYGQMRIAIQALYEYATNNAIRFSGKGFYLFPSPVYYLNVGLLMMVLWLVSNQMNLKQKIKHALISIMFFGVAFYAVVYITSMGMLISCTLCDEGIMMINRNEVEYELILAASCWLAMLPSSAKLIRSALP